MSRIVVGTDGSPCGTAALRWALEEAELRASEVELVFGWLVAAASSDMTGLAAASFEPGGRREGS